MTSIVEIGVSAPTLRREIFRDKLDIDIEDFYMVINLQVFISTFSVLIKHIESF